MYNLYSAGHLDKQHQDYYNNNKANTKYILFFVTIYFHPFQFSILKNHLFTFFAGEYTDICAHVQKNRNFN